MLAREGEDRVGQVLAVGTPGVHLQQPRSVPGQHACVAQHRVQAPLPCPVQAGERSGVGETGEGGGQIHGPYGRQKPHGAG